MTVEHNDQERLAVSVRDAAAMIGLGRDVTYRLILGGDIPSFKVGARRLVPVASLRQDVERRTAETEDETPREGTLAGRAPR